MFGLQGITSAGAALMRKAANDSAKIVFTRARAGSGWSMNEARFLRTTRPGME